MFEKLTCSAAAEFDLEAAGPVLVSGRQSSKTDPTMPDSSFMTGVYGKDHGNIGCVIPGSAVKGVIRHYIEDNILPASEAEKLFGYAGDVSARSKIKFRDAYAVPETVVISVRHSTAINALMQSARNTSLNNMGVVEKGVFRCGYIFTNYTEKEMTAVLRALIDINTGIVRFGGRKSRGFGQMKVTGFSMRTHKGFDASLRPVDEMMFTELEDTIEYFCGSGNF